MTANLFHIGQGKIETLHDLFLDQLRDLYDAELQLLKALPQMAEAAHDRTLKANFLTHLDETRGHVHRLEEIFELLDEDPDGKTCEAMKGLIREGKETIHADAAPEVKDAALIAAAQRVEHYEIAGYGTVRTYADLMGHTITAVLLQKTLDEEGQANRQLTAVARTLNLKVPTGHSHPAGAH